LAYNKTVKPGTYYVKVLQRGDEVHENNAQGGETLAEHLKSRLFPVEVFNGWHTQVFMTLGDQPLFGTLRIIVSRERGFDPKSELNKYIDILVDKIQNNEPCLSQDLIKFVANHKIDSPMLAMLCIYAYMNGESDLNDSAIGRMIDVLTALILRDNSHSPDIKAIELLGERYLGDEVVDKRELNGVPMLRLGVEAVSDAAMNAPSLITPYGMIDYAIESLNHGSVFTVFDWNETNVVNTSDSPVVVLVESLAKMIINGKGQNQRKALNAEQILNSSQQFLDQITENAKWAPPSVEVLKGAVSLAKRVLIYYKDKKKAVKLNEKILKQDAGKKMSVDAIQVNSKSSTTALYIANFITENPIMDIPTVSENLRIPQPVIERVLKVPTNPEEQNLDSGRRIDG
jgi:hypothetical protein